MEYPRIRLSGGYVVHVDLCGEVSRSCVEKVHALYYYLLKGLSELRGVEVVPSISSVAVVYDPRAVKGEKLRRIVEEALGYIGQVDARSLYRPRRFVVPVVYGGEYGSDLGWVASWAKMSVEEVVRIHVSRVYLVYSLGFTPGFVYLGEVDERIAAPRLETPRTRIPAGSVGIAGRLTGFYGVESPGGWRIIGRTPIRTFDPRRTPPTPVRPGDEVVFKPITPEEFRRLEGVFIGDYTG